MRSSATWPVRQRTSTLGAWACAWLILAEVACATRVPPPMPAVLVYPDFLYLVVPATLQKEPGASRIETGWRFLQSDNVSGADVEFGAALKLESRLYPAHVGLGYVAMTGRDYDRALTSFEQALESNGRYVPALVGRGQALLALERADEALVAFESALDVDPELTELRRRVELLRFRHLQDLIDAARAAVTAGRPDEARRAYGRALAASPQSAFLHRELGLVERAAGNADAALEHVRQAVALDPLEAPTFVALGELLQERGDLGAAEAAYRHAAAIDPDLDLAARIAETGTRAREARLPPQFQAALSAGQVTRGELAALMGVRLEDLIVRAPARQVVMTDTQGHWAAPWITLTANAGVIEAFENHTFQPGAVVRRGDLATTMSRVVALVAASSPAVRARLTERPAIADMTAGHAQYGAVAAVVATGVMPLPVDRRFQVARPVSGPEAVEAIGRLRALAATILGEAQP